MSVSNNQQTANLWITIHYMGASLIPASFALYVYTFLKIEREKKFSLGIWWVIGIAFFVVTLVRRELFVSASSTKPFFAYYTQGGIFYPLYTLVFFLCVGEAILYLIKNLKGRHSVSAKHVQYVLMASIVGFGGGATAFLPVFDLNIYPYGMLFVFLYPMIMTYAIIRHRLMDIEVIIKRTLVFAGLFAMVMATVTLVTGLAQSFVGEYLRMGERLSMAISGLIILLLYGPVKQWLVDATDKFLFQKKETIRVILNRLAGNIITILDLNQVGQTILATLRESMRLESGAIILKDESGKGYYVLDSFNVKAARAYYEEENFFIKYLSEHTAILNLEEESLKKRLPTMILSRLEEFSAALCIPLFLHRELIGILTLGKKKSDEPFTEEELGYLPAVAGQVAIALSNARLHDIQRKSQIEFIQQAKMAAVGTLSAGINHEIKNPLNNMMGAIEMHLMNREAGFFKNHSKEDYQSEVNKVFDSVLEDVKKAMGTIKALARFAHKGGEELRAEPVDLEKEVDGAYLLLKSHLLHDQIEFVKEFPKNLPKVMGDGARINEVLVNIINNARQAIKKNGTIKVAAKKNSRSVDLDIIDNGPGMSEEILQKLFDPFFTTKDQGEGTGLGLHICREILKRMDAKITVKSEAGKGAAFTLEFPLAP